MAICTLPGAKNRAIASGSVAHGSEDEMRQNLELIFAGTVRERNTEYEYVMTCTKTPVMGTNHAWRLFRLGDASAISPEKVDEIHSSFIIFLCRKSDGAGIVTKEHKAILAEMYARLLDTP